MLLFSGAAVPSLDYAPSAGIKAAVHSGSTYVRGTHFFFCFISPGCRCGTVATTCAEDSRRRPDDLLTHTNAHTQADERSATTRRCSLLALLPSSHRYWLGCATVCFLGLVDDWRPDRRGHGNDGAVLPSVVVVAALVRQVAVVVEIDHLRWTLADPTLCICRQLDSASALQ